MWERLASRLCSVVLLGPQMTEYYKRTLIKEVRLALESVEQVEEVSSLKFSFPVVASEAPQPSLASWSGELSEPMEWDVRWTPASWDIAVSVKGRHFGLGFSLALRLHHFGVGGRVRVALPEARSLDLSKVLFSFLEFPEVDFQVESSVAFGIVPLPVQAQVDTKIRSASAKWLSRHLVEPNAMHLDIAAMRPKRGVSENDLQTAIRDAELAKAWRSREA